MRNLRIGFASVAALAWIVAANGCTSTSTNSGTGGTTGKGGSSGGTTGSGGASGGTTGSGGKTGSGGSSASGGSGGTSTAPNCPNGTSCGGSLVGTWNVISSCLALSGDMDGNGLYLGCAKIPVTGSLNVTGTWTANSDGTYADNTTTTGSMTFPLSPSCLTVSSAPVECAKVSGVFTAYGWATANCSTDASGQCNCSVTANQKGGIGVIYPNASNQGTYSTSGGTLNVDQEVNYSYCVSSNSLTLTPTPGVLPLAGTVVLQKNSPPGTGGASGGASGSGGKGGAGGTTTGSGGATTGTGGATGGAGGTKTGAGGATATGGTAGAGGTTATGGTAGTGGTTATGGGSGQGPCDIYAAANANCVAAHSTVRALFGSYSGKLYQVKRASDSKTKDISVTAGGVADWAAQDTFCTGTTCMITIVYDQSGNGNFVEAETPDSTVGGHTGQSASNATQEPLTVGGHKVYSLYMKTAQAYWRDGSKSRCRSAVHRKASTW